MPEDALPRTERDRAEAEVAEERERDAADAPEGIGGWLLVPVLYVVIVAFVTTEYLLEARLPWLRPEILAGNVAVIAGSVVALVLLFQERRLAPAWMTAYYVVVVAVCGLEVASLTVFSQGLDPALVRSELGPAREGLGHALGHAVLFIPYFWASERVRNTFVE